MIYLYEMSNVRVTTTFKASGSIVFLYPNIKCCETKWLPSFGGNINTFAQLFTGLWYLTLSRLRHHKRPTGLAAFYS